jgi:hypothetical protein
MRSGDEEVCRIGQSVGFELGPESALRQHLLAKYSGTPPFMKCLDKLYRHWQNGAGRRGVDVLLTRCYRENRSRARREVVHGEAD